MMAAGFEKSFYAVFSGVLQEAGCDVSAAIGKVKITWDRNGFC